jgi:hypothetical protein
MLWRVEDQQEMRQLPKQRSPEELRVGSVNFILEQDGVPERELKAKLVTFFNSAAWVKVAYLAQVTYQDAGPSHVALCVRGQPGQNRIFAERVGTLFASIFGSHEHMDVLWITPEQEIALARVCRPFYCESNAPP